MFFSKWLVIVPSSCPGHVNFARTPTLASLVYGTALMGPIECHQLLLDVSCTSVHSRCISSHKTGAYTLFFKKNKRGAVQPCPNCLGFAK